MSKFSTYKIYKPSKASPDTFYALVRLILCWTFSCNFPHVRPKIPPLRKSKDPGNKLGMYREISSWIELPGKRELVSFGKQNCFLATSI